MRRTGAPSSRSRLEPLYHELMASYRQYEGVHDYWRDRYRVASDTLANRPKIVSLNWHRLRANVACFIDWLRIAAKNGWLGSARPAKRLRKGARTKMDAGILAAKKSSTAAPRTALTCPTAPRRQRSDSARNARPRSAPAPHRDRRHGPSSRRPAAQEDRPWAASRFPGSAPARRALRRQPTLECSDQKRKRRPRRAAAALFQNSRKNCPHSGGEIEPATFGL